MFSTRLNPTKPPAAHRAILERVGAACRELRPVEEACYREWRPNDQIATIFTKHGALGVGIATEFGGAGTEPLLNVLAAERIGREGYGPCSWFAAHTALGAATIARWGTPEQKARYLPAAARGECILGFAQHEPYARADSTLEREMVFQETAAGFVLNGCQRKAVNAEPGGALLMFARDRAASSLSAFIVHANTLGMAAAASPGETRLPSGALYDLFLDNCEVPPTNLLGERGQGSQVLAAALLNGRLCIAAGSVGVLADCLERSASHASTRIRSGEAAACRPVIEEHIAQTAVDLEAARALVYAAAELKAEYDRRPTSEHLQLETDTLVSEAKYFATSAVQNMLIRAGDIDFADCSLRACLPDRHQFAPRATAVVEQPQEILEERIAPYYLFK